MNAGRIPLLLAVRNGGGFGAPATTSCCTSEVSATLAELAVAHAECLDPAARAVMEERLLNTILADLTTARAEAR